MNKMSLNTEEKKIAEKQLERHMFELDLLKKRLEYNKDCLSMQTRQRTLENEQIKHKDKWRVFLREQKDLEDKEILKQFEKDIEQHELHIKDLNDTLTKGKNIPKGV